MTLQSQAMQKRRAFQDGGWPGFVDGGLRCHVAFPSISAWTKRTRGLCGAPGILPEAMSLPLISRMQRFAGLLFRWCFIFGLYCTKRDVFFANFWWLFIFGLTQTPFGTFWDFIIFVRFPKHIQGFFLWILPWTTSGGKSEVQQNSSASLAKHERIRTDASFVQWLQVLSVKWSSPKSIEKLVSFVWWYV